MALILASPHIAAATMSLGSQVTAAQTTPAPSPSPSGPDVEPTLPSLEPSLADAPDFLRPWLAVLIPAAVAVVATWLVFFVLRHALRNNASLRDQVARLAGPVFSLLLALGLMIGTNGLVKDEFWASVVDAILKVGFIAAATWLMVVVISVFETSLLQHYEEADTQARQMAKMRTQVTLVKRVITALVLVIGVAIVLMMIPSVQRLGTTILASAGLISVVVGLAVQGVLANVFAGLQVAFTDAIRVDDVVVVETQQGRIKEITLTYVVVGMADGRNMILPSTYFTTKPFENWSRGGSELNGNVVLDLNWNAPVDRIRHRVTQLLEASDLWDGRTGTTQVTGAEGGIIKLTITLSARNSGDLYDLKNQVREKIVAELQEKHPGALPHQQHQA